MMVVAVAMRMAAVIMIMVVVIVRVAIRMVMRWRVVLVAVRHSAVNRSFCGVRIKSGPFAMYHGRPNHARPSITSARGAGFQAVGGRR